MSWKVHREDVRLDSSSSTWTWTEIREGFGKIERRHVTATSWVETSRTNCWCCSCEVMDSDLGTVRTDAACRTHGWWGRRPCEEHGMPGEINPEGEMPATVQERRRGVKGGA